MNTSITNYFSKEQDNKEWNSPLLEDSIPFGTPYNIIRDENSKLS